MSTVLQIYEAIDRLAPFFLSMDFDNTGILVGDRQKKVERALLALDCTKEVLRQAKELGAPNRCFRYCANCCVSIPSGRLPTLPRKNVPCASIGCKPRQSLKPMRFASRSFTPPCAMSRLVCALMTAMSLRSRW